MVIESNIVKFSISVPFEQWAAVCASKKNRQLLKEEKIICLYTWVKNDDRSSSLVIEQTEEGKSIEMFSNHEVKHLIEEAGHICDSTVITSYLQS
tara:strand:- start:173 stop:457 length:285 start_codon:yes stop_codon:yes gene_type:complete